MNNWIQNLRPSPILIEWGIWQIHWYGLLIAIAIVIGIIVTTKLARARKIPTKAWDNILFYGLIGGLIGARLYHVILEWQYYYQNPVDIIKVWQGGLAIHGAILGGLLIVYLLCKRYKLFLWQVTDILIIGVLIGQIIGRWGNFFNQELFGLPTGLPWGIYIELLNRPAGYLASNYFHPTFLYESLANLILLIVILEIYKRRYQLSGLITGVYLIGYSVIRFFLEFIRIDRTPELWGLRWPQWASLIIILGVAVYWLHFRKGLPKLKKSV